MVLKVTKRAKVVEKTKIKKTKNSKSMSPMTGIKIYLMMYQSN